MVRLAVEFLQVDLEIGAHRPEYLLVDRSLQFYGCMNCEGCRKAEKSALVTRPQGTHMERHLNGHAGVGGFGGWRIRLNTPEDEAAFARAGAMRDAGLALLGKR
jgi:hypothetical protein